MFMHNAGKAGGWCNEDRQFAVRMYSHAADGAPSAQYQCCGLLLTDGCSDDAWRQEELDGQRDELDKHLHGAPFRGMCQLMHGGVCDVFVPHPPANADLIFAMCARNG